MLRHYFILSVLLEYFKYIIEPETTLKQSLQKIGLFDIVINDNKIFLLPPN